MEKEREGRPLTEAALARPSGKMPGSLETGNRCLAPPGLLLLVTGEKKPTGGSTLSPPSPGGPKPVQEVSQLSLQPEAQKQNQGRKRHFGRSQELCLPEVLRGSSISLCSDALFVDKSKLMVIKREAFGGEVC